MNGLAAYGLLAHGLIFGALAATLPLGEFRARVGLAATALALTVGIAPLMHGSFGTPSLTLLQLALLQLTGRAASPLTFRPALGLLLLALCLYPATLGIWPFDPYAAGYQPSALLAALLALAGALWWTGRADWLLILALDLAGYAGGLFANLWDALLDPLLVLLALAVVGRRAVRRFSGSATR